MHHPAQDSGLPFGGFLDDYFAECDEHLGAVRREVLTLERALEDPQGAGVSLEALFRSFHSLKGLSAMVELRVAEELSHELESYLRAVRTGAVALAPAGVEALLDGTRLLEHVIAARRDGQAPPDIAPMVARLTALVRGTPAAAMVTTSGGAARARRADDRPMWRVVYVPSPALAERGVTVNTVRARLEDGGTITHAAPRVTPDGGIAFEFIVASDADADTVEAWRADMSVEPYTPPAPVASAPPHADGAAPVDAATATVAPSHFVRVDLTRLDDIMRIIGDLVIARARLAETLNRIEASVPPAEWRAVQDNAQAIERHLRDLREGVMRVRLVPIGAVFERMLFVVRDLARDRDKRVRLDVQGQATEIDKFLIEQLMDPILHLVRNAVDHGVESPAERQAAGKPPEGVVALRASTAGETVVIEVEDDGRGVDAARVVERARAVGHPVPDGPLDDAVLLDLLCAAGFSTREAADRVSGRGVGMAVVRSTIRALGGTVSVATEVGRGTRFTMHLPLTLAITEALIASVSGRTFAIPQGSIREVMEIDAASVRRLESNEIIPYRGGTLPVLRLARLFGLPDEPRPILHAFVVGRGLGAIAIAVDRIIGQKEIVVRTFTDSLLDVDGVTGATELGDGRVVLIVDPTALTRRAMARPAADAARGRARHVHARARQGVSDGG